MSEMKVKERSEDLRNGTLVDKGYLLGLLGGFEGFREVGDFERFRVFVGRMM